MDNTNNIPQNIEYMCVWTPQDIFLKLSGNKWKKARKPLFTRLSGSFNDSHDAVMTLKSSFQQGVQSLSKFSLLMRVQVGVGIEGRFYVLMTEPFGY